MMQAATNSNLRTIFIVPLWGIDPWSRNPSKGYKGYTKKSHEKWFKMSLRGFTTSTVLFSGVDTGGETTCEGL